MSGPRGKATTNSRTDWRLAVALGAAALVSTAWLDAWAWQASAAYAAARADSDDCRRLADEIAKLRGRPKPAGLEADSPEVIAERVEAASQAAGLPPRALQRVEPQAPARVERTSYRQRITRIALRRVTLAQLAAFCYHLSDDQRGWTVRDLTLTPEADEQGSAGDELWSVEVALTQLIFSPTTR